MPLTSDSTAEQAVTHGNVKAATRAIAVWRADMPRIPETVSRLVRHIGFDDGQQQRIMAAASLAAEPNDHPYHNNRHFLEVALIAAMLGNHAYKRGDLTLNTLCNQIQAALLHDREHDGTGNNGIQFRLEDKAYEGSKAALAAAGNTPDDLADIRALILATDVSKDFANPAAISPAQSVDVYARSGNVAALHPELRRLAERDLLEAACILKDADLTPSLLSARNARESGQALARERGVPYEPGAVTGFFKCICGDRMSSRAGRALIQHTRDKTVRDFTSTLGSPTPAHA